jgi:hypothetical protein
VYQDHLSTGEANLHHLRDNISAGHSLIHVKQAEYGYYSLPCVLTPSPDYILFVADFVSF